MFAVYTAVSFKTNGCNTFSLAFLKCTFGPAFGPEAKC